MSKSQLDFRWYVNNSELCGINGNNRPNLIKMSKTI